MAENLSYLPKDIGIVGTFIPGPEGQIGFMDCGVVAAKRVTENILSPEPARAQWLEQMLSRSQGQGRSTEGAGYAI
jgi:hypothetical protein